MPWRLLKWVVLTLALGAFPYLFAAALLHLEEPARSAFPSSPEILFLALSASAAALADLLDDGSVAEGAAGASPGRAGRKYAVFFLGLCLVATGVTYGAYVHHGLHAPGRGAAVDCAAVAEAISIGSSETLHPPDAVLAQWGRPCLRWAATQDAFFRWSGWVTVVAAVASTFLVMVFVPRR